MKDRFTWSQETQVYSFISLEGKLKKQIAQTAKGLNQLLHLGSNKLLCSTTSGLLWYDGDAERLSQLRLHENGKELEWDGAICMKQASDSIVWVGTMAWGLIKVNIKTLEAKMYTPLTAYRVMILRQLK